MLGDEDGEDEHILEFKIRFTPFVLLLLLEEEDAAEIHANGCVEFVVDDEDEFPIFKIVIIYFYFIFFVLLVYYILLLLF